MKGAGLLKETARAIFAGPVSRWRCFAVLLAGVTLTSCQQHEGYSSYFPLQVGNRWEYQLDDTPIKQIREVVAREAAKDGYWYRIRTSYKGPVDPAHGASEMWLRIKGPRLLRRAGNRRWGATIADFSALALRSYAAAELCVEPGMKVPNGSELRAKYLVKDGCDGEKLNRQTFLSDVGIVSFTDDSFMGHRSWRISAAHIAGEDLYLEW